MVACAADLRQVGLHLVSWRVVGAAAKDHIAWIELETNREHADGDRHGLTRVARGAFAEPLAAIDQWSAAQDDEPSRPEAVRRLVQVGLAASATNKPSRKKRGAD
jgi:hypothetical protein